MYQNFYIFHILNLFLCGGLMSFKNNLFFILFILGILFLSVCIVSADSYSSDGIKVTVDGVNFILSPDCNVIKEEGDVVIFELNSEVNGYITSLKSEQELNNYIMNDSSKKHGAEKIDSYTFGGDEYLFCKGLHTVGAFVLFQKNDKNFIYHLSTSMEADNETIKSIATSAALFGIENGITPIHSSEGKSFADCRNYFPNASDVVRKHVFDEADKNKDGYLSDSEFKIFKKVRDHTNNYAYNIKNEYPTKKPGINDKTGYCADHGRVKVNSKNQCPYCIKLHYKDTRTRIKPF